MRGIFAEGWRYANRLFSGSGGLPLFKKGNDAFVS